MSSDYPAIRRDNERRYGTDIGRIGPMLLADCYDDRTHFIFELLQNAEDALARRGQWQGARGVSFHLTDTHLRVSHFGQPFNEADVRGICGIAESTKALTAIGRFGIGFKSVYAITDRPEVHSGTEAFAIESFVWPVAVQPAPRHNEETLFILPFKRDDSEALDDVSRGLKRLGATALLFLRNIEEIRWSLDGGHSGTYLRDSKDVADWVRHVTVIGDHHETGEVDDEWLVFSRAVATQDGRHAGYVELAFSHSNLPGERIQPVERSPLVVFFPTVVETHLGFLLQGPYRTTPSRDNVPRSDPWNQHLIDETGALLVEALRWLRANDFLDTAALRCLPIDASKFGEGSMFAPLFRVTKRALSFERLLPRFGGGHAPAVEARLGRTQELRDLFTASQLAGLLGEQGEVCWLSGDVSQDRAPELRRYLMQELGVAELTPEAIIAKLNKAFLEAQADTWIVALYEFLNGQAALRRRLDDSPLIRLEHGTHVPPRGDGQPQAFLPTSIATGFPTVRASVCTTDTAREFLRSLGLTEPDPVDDVVRNVLPKYAEDEVDVDDAQYEADIRRMLTASATDSKTRQEKLIAALGDTKFVMAVDAGDGSKCVSKPGEVYLATERMKELFAAVKGVLLVDDEYSCLRGEDVRKLLEASGASRYLQPIPGVASFSWEERRGMRLAAGCGDCTWEEPVQDQTLRGLDQLFSTIPTLDAAGRAKRATLLWEALADVVDRRGISSFSGTYRWTYYYRRSTTFDAAFVRKLNSEAWVPEGNGELQRPDFVLFDTLGWKSNPYLQSKVCFKRPLIETLAREAGIEPGVLDLLKKHGVTSVVELIARLGLSDESKPRDGEPSSETVNDEGTELPDTASIAVGGGSKTEASKADRSGDQRGESGAGSGPGGSGSGGRSEGASTGQRDQRTRPKDAPGPQEKERAPEGAPFTFISYIGVHPDSEEADAEGLDQQARMALEAKAIEFILSREPQWRRTPTHNPGYDLYVADEGGNTTQYCEVKAMTGSLDDHPVGLSRTQFDCAREHGEAYWLYVVERAGTDAARIVRIQDPAGKARTFTFDRGWVGVARLDGAPEERDL